MQRTAIFGGTFNPVHKEHIALAKTAVSLLRLNKLIVMPTFMPPHKSVSLAPAEDRLNMLKLAFQDCPNIEVSDYEILNGGKSYSYITCEHIKKEYGGQVFFIVGGDMLSDFKTWKNPERILDAVTLVAAHRSDFFADVDKEREYFVRTFGKDFISLPFVGESASSTEIRVYNSLGLSIENMTDGKVARYISEKGLFGGGKLEEFIKKTLPLKRLVHTADVAVCALKKAKQLGLSEEKVKTASILHDCAKYLDYREFKDFALPEDVPAPVVHAFLGAYVAEKILGVTDPEIIDAIRYHTSGKAEMSALGKLIFVADMVEKGRTYEGVEKLRALYEKDFEECFIECLKEEVLHLMNKKQYIYVETLNAYDYYIKKLGK